MSEDWRVWCRDCEEEHYFCDANHMEREMAMLCKHAKAIAALAPMFDDDLSCIVSLSLGGHYGPINVHWFAKHANHDLTPRSEYGTFPDQCQEYQVRCSGCDRTHRCVLSVGHDGPHSVKPQDAKPPTEDEGLPRDD